MDSLRVRWVPLLQSFQRLGAFASGTHPHVHGFTVLRLLCPIRLPKGIGVSSRVSPFLLSTLLRIPGRLSRVHHGGLKQNAVGGVLLNAPSPLWGSPVFLQGSIRLTWSPMHSHPMEEAWVPALHKRHLQARQADITSKVCQGPLFP